MRITIFSENILPLIKNKKGKYGGAELQLYLLFKGLLEIFTYQINVVTKKDYEYSPDQYSQTNVKFYLVLDDSEKNKIAHIKNVWRLLRIFKHNFPGIIITRGGTPLLAVLGIIARKTRGKLVYALSSNRNAEEIGWSWREIKKHSASYLGEMFYRLGIQLADVIIAQTHTQKRTFLTNMRKNIKVIPNLPPFDIEDAETGMPDSNNKKYVIWVGRISPEKNPLKFVELAKRMPNLRFLIVGIPQDKKLYSQILNEAKNIPNLTVLESIPHKELVQLYHQSMILVNTSIREGLSNTFIEAWSTGLPVATTWNDPDGIIARYRLGVYCPDIDCVQKYIKVLFENPKLQKKLRRYTKRYVYLKHSKQRILNKYYTLFKDLSGGIKK